MQHATKLMVFSVEVEHPQYVLTALLSPTCVVVSVTEIMGHLYEKHVPEF